MIVITRLVALLAIPALALALLAAVPASAETGYTEIVSYDEQGKIAGGCYSDLRAAAEAAQEFVQDPDVVRYEGKILIYSPPCHACDLRTEIERIERLKDVARRLREVTRRCPR